MKLNNRSLYAGRICFDAPGDAGGTPPVTTPKTFTQADVDSIVTTRLAREKEKYADYDTLKAAAAKLAELEKANLTEAERLKAEISAATQRAEAAELEAAAAAVNVMKTQLLLAASLPVDLVERVRGTTEEEIKADIELLKPLIKGAPKTPGSKVPPAGTQYQEPEAGAYGRDLAKKLSPSAQAAKAAANFFKRPE